MGQQSAMATSALAGGATPYAAAGTAALGAGMGIYNAIEEAKKKREIAAEIAKQEAVPLTNIADGMKVSTLGSDIRKDQASQMGINAVDALKEGGSRALIGGLGTVAANSNDVNSEIAADLDSQQKNIDMIRANDEAVIRGVKEDRSRAKLAALSSQYNAANQNQNMNTGNALYGAGSTAVNLVNAGNAGNGNIPAGVGSVGSSQPTAADYAWFDSYMKNKQKQGI